MTIEITELDNGKLQKLEVNGEEKTSYRPVVSGTPEYDKLVEEAKTKKIKIKKKSKAEKDKKVKDDKRQALKAERNRRIASECFCEVPSKGVLAVATPEHRMDLYLASLEPLNTLWVMADGYAKLLTQQELQAAYAEINPKYRAIWEDYANQLKEL